MDEGSLARNAENTTAISAENADNQTQECKEGEHNYKRISTCYQNEYHLVCRTCGKSDTTEKSYT